MTKEQIYHRRLARHYGKKVAIRVHWVVDDPNYRGAGSVYSLAKESAWHAFRAHPEMREA